MRGSRFVRPTLLGFAIASTTLPPAASGEIGDLTLGGFTVFHEIVLPGSPDAIYDAVTGDISGWWDHSFSGDPARFYIEPKPGGGFYEIFDESGDGVLHATVIFARRGETLRFVGPLGLTGNSIDMVHTYTFEPTGDDSTRFRVTVRASGEIAEGWAEAVDRTWRHFLFDRLAPHVVSEAP